MIIRPVKQTIHYIKRKFTPAALILMYHRVSDTSVEPNWLAVAPTNFAQHMRHLRQSYQPVHLLDLIEGIQQRSLPNRAVAVTFDDGYRDNLTCALPELEANNIPATIFVTTSYVDSEHEPWWDEVKHFLLEPLALPPTLSLQINRQEYRWSTNTFEERLNTHQALEDLMRPLPTYINDRILDHLAQWSNRQRRYHPAYRTVTSSELNELASHPLIDLGAHTITHPILPTLSLDAQFNEIVGSRYSLEKMINRQVHSFAYPNGDYSEQTRKLVDAAGYKAACTTVNGTVQQGDDVFQLRRCAINDWNIERFKQQMEAFFNDRS